MLLWRNLDPKTLLAVLASVRREPPKVLAGAAPKTGPVAAGKPVA